jgi:uncharacterized membrane protein
MMPEDQEIIPPFQTEGNNPSQAEQSNTRNERSSNAIEVSAQFQGPVPPPQVMAGYEEIVPGAADRLIAMAEREQAHRHQQQERLLNAQITDARQDRLEARVGQIFALIIGLGSISAGATTAVLGAAIAGGFIGTGGVATLAAVFIMGRGKAVKND